jgi:type II secretory ATPase GspE/PulE/Tfp pilus assembly ATPase PilB-like protein
MLADCLKLAISQRLVKKLCPRYATDEPVRAVGAVDGKANSVDAVPVDHLGLISMTETVAS